MAFNSKEYTQNWHQLPIIQERYRCRLDDISNILSYSTGDKIHHGRSIINNFDPIRFSHTKQGYFVDEFAENIHEKHECYYNEILIADYYAGLNLEIPQSEPNISSYWNMNLNCLHQKN